MGMGRFGLCIDLYTKIDCIIPSTPLVQLFTLLQYTMTGIFNTHIHQCCAGFHMILAYCLEIIYVAMLRHRIKTCRLNSPILT